MRVREDHFYAFRSGLELLGTNILLFSLLIILTGCPSEVTEISPTKKIEETDTNSGTNSDLSGIVPAHVNLPNPDTLTDVENRPFFDEFSWNTFIALCWPVVEGQRGVPLDPNDPSTFLNMTNSTPVVWTSYKNQYDLFGTDSPTPWNSPTAQSSPVSGANTNHVMLGSINAKSIIHGEADESFSVPLIDQSQNYALFEIRYNQVQYDFIYDNNLFLKSDLVKYQIAHDGVVTMPASNGPNQGSILAKAAWKILVDGVDDSSRYYFVDEIVYDPVSNSNKKLKMGLVGFHIAQKVEEFPQWVWSSFEHVDNVPNTPNGQKPYSFNNGTDPNIPATGDRGYANMPDSTGTNPDQSTRTPVQVNRLNPVPTTPTGQSTVDINARYQAVVSSTWMKNYQLVITQWPTNPSQFKQSSQGGVYPQDSGQPFPINGCANTTMETYFQSQSDAAGSGGNSCMACHYKANNMDYSWSLFLRSH